MTSSDTDGWTYLQIADHLREGIESGKYEPGKRVPGENALMKTYAVARGTARHALDVIKNEGLVESRKGAGVFVRDFRPIRRQGIKRLSAEQWGNGRSIWSNEVDNRTLVVDQVTVSEESAPQHIAAVMDLDDDNTVCVRRRRFVLDGKPVLLATSYLPASAVAGSAITQEDTGPGGIYARLAELGHKPVHFREELRSRMPMREQAAQLEIPAGTPVTLICRTAFTEDGQAIEVNEMTLDANAYILEYEFDA